MIVLDTHAWLWWVAAPRKLMTSAQDAMDRVDQIGVCTISCWEVAMLVESGRITIDRPIERWIAHALAHPRLVALPLTAEVAVAAALLGRESFPGDPADRIIYATARQADAKLVTRDKQLRRFVARAAIW